MRPASELERRRLGETFAALCAIPSPTFHERAVADRVVAALPGLLPGAGDGPLLYARVDLLPAPDGAPVVLEVELTEPSLFLSFGDGATERFADAIARRLVA